MMYWVCKWLSTLSSFHWSAGYYCPSPAMTWPMGECEGGYYCPGGDDTPTPSTECTMGYCCPLGSALPLPCPGGEYCAEDLMSNTSGLCDAGYYCYSKAITPTPNDGNVTGTVSLLFLCVCVYKTTSCLIFIWTYGMNIRYHQKQ